MPGAARREWFGTAATGMAAAALAVNLLLVLGLIVLVGVRGLGHFWQPELVELTLHDGTRVLGEVWERQALPSGEGMRTRLKTGNRDLAGADFAWVDEPDVASRAGPGDGVGAEGLEWGSFFGYPVALRRGEQTFADGADAVFAALPALLESKRELHARMRGLERGEIEPANRRLEALAREEARGQ